MWMDAVKQDMLLILDRIISITQAGKRHESKWLPHAGKCAHKTKSSCATKDMLGEVKVHVFRKAVR